MERTEKDRKKERKKERNRKEEAKAKIECGGPEMEKDGSGACADIPRR